MALLSSLSGGWLMGGQLWWPGSSCKRQQLHMQGCHMCASLNLRAHPVQVGAAAVGGGALFAVTGGLAAPAIAAGMGR